MPKCKKCAHYRPTDSDPFKGICTASQKELGEITSVAIEGKIVGSNDESCEVFLDKKKVDRAQMLRSGF